MNFPSVTLSSPCFITKDIQCTVNVFMNNCILLQNIDPCLITYNYSVHPINNFMSNTHKLHPPTMSKSKNIIMSYH